MLDYYLIHRIFEVTPFFTKKRQFQTFQEQGSHLWWWLL